MGSAYTNGDPEAVILGGTSKIHTHPNNGLESGTIRKRGVGVVNEKLGVSLDDRENYSTRRSRTSRDAVIDRQSIYLYTDKKENVIKAPRNFFKKKKP